MFLRVGSPEGLMSGRVMAAILSLAVTTVAPLAGAQPVAVAGVARPMPVEMSSRYTRLHAQLQPSASAWVESQARIEAQRPAPDLTSLEGAIQSRFGGLTVGGSDIAAMAYLVLMEATSDADKDLQAIMAAVQSENQAKQQLRDLLNKVNQLYASMATVSPNTPCTSPPCNNLSVEFAGAAAAAGRAGQPLRTNFTGPLTPGRLRQIQATLGADLNSMNEMSEMTSMRLQMAMDRRSKFVDTLSNVLKQIDGTAESIVANMK
jgi:hypothetical protein